MQLADLPFAKEAPLLRPPLSIIDAQHLLANAGLLVDQYYQLGLVAVWNVTPEPFAEALFAEGPLIAQALGAPELAGMHDVQVVDWLRENERYGWLIRAEQLFQPDTHQITPRPAALWVYAERFDLAIEEAVNRTVGQQG